MSMSFFACLAAVIQFQSCVVEPAGKQVVVRAAKTSVVRPVVVDLSNRGGALWQGFYAGGSLGYGNGKSTQHYDRNANHGLATVTPDGTVFSATAGYNTMVSSNFLAGIEGDIGLMDLDSGTHTVYDGHHWRGQFGSFWGTVRARAGYVHDKWLFFGSGGFAFMETDNVSIGNTAPETAMDKDMRTGWVLGAGVEYAFSERLSGKLEYLHMDFGKYSSLSANNEDFFFKDKTDIIRFGVNYRF